MKRKLVVFLLALVSCLACAFGLAACDLVGKPDDGGKNDDIATNFELIYELRSGEYAIVGYSGKINNSDRDMVIPTIYEGLPVTSIGSGAFEYCSGLTSITIPDGVTSIGSGAFYNCSGLTSITIPDSVTSIGERVFLNCSGLTIYCETASQPDGWDSDWNYSSCPVIWDCKNNNTASDGYVYEYIDGLRYQMKDGVATVYQQPTTLTGAVVIPSTVTYNETTYNVTSIVSYAFYDCSGLTSVTIGNGVTSIGGSAFRGCSSLTSVTIPDSVTSIGKSAFYGEAYYNEESNWDNDVLYIDKHLIEAKTSLSGAYTIKEGTLTIASSAFSNCSGLTSVTIPDSVTAIGDEAFRYCSNLESITLPFVGAIKDGTNNTHFGYIFGASSFSDNSSYVPKSLKTVTITGDSSIGISAFRSCRSLTSVTIGDGVTSIGDIAFEYCSGLTSVTIGDSVTSIGEDAFKDCSSIENATIPAFAIDYIPTKSLQEVVITSGEIGSYAFSGCSGLTSVTIGDGVTSIGSGAFWKCSGLEAVYITDMAAWCAISFYNTLSSNPLYYAHNLYLNDTLVTDLVIPDGVTSIGEYSFIYCSSLTSITIPDSVTFIGDSAFSGCSGLTSVTIGNGVTSIGEWAFRNCSSLSSITVDENNDYYKSIDGNLYNKDRTKFIQYAIGKTDTSFVIPDSVTSIGSLAFENCSGLTSITISDSVISIGSYAFSGCSSLESITLPFIGSSASATEASSSTLFGYIFGTSSYTGGTATKQYYSSSAYSTYYIPTSLKSVTITGGNILYGAFYGCSGLTSITIPDGVTSIGNSAFGGCSGLTSITIPDGVTSIGNSAFGGCSGLTSITIPDGVISIGDYAFRYCCGITSIKIPDSVTSIGEGAFIDCSSLESITLPFVGSSASATEASSSTLFGYIFGKSSYTGGTATKQYYTNSSYSTYYIPASLKSVTVTGGNILYGAFYNCTTLTSIKIPDGVTSIGEYAFRGCSGLTSIYYTGDIAGWCSISGLDNLMSSTRTLYINDQELTGKLVIPDGVTSIGEYAFYYCSGLTSITIPDGVTSIGEYAFRGCSGLTSVTIGNGVTSIGEYAFSGCSSLENITLPFVGSSASAKEASSSTLFGYIFGTSSYTGGTKTEQYYATNSYSTYYIPTSLKSVTVTGGNIFSGAFFYCSGLTSITIGNGVTSIGYWAFRNCSSLTSITVDENNDYYKSIDGNLYNKDCTKFIQYAIGKTDTSFVIPDSVTSIGSLAFENCSSLTSITIDNGVTSISSSGFSGCSAGIIWGDNPVIKSIGSYAFSHYAGTSITIPDGVTSIGSYAFYGCSGLTSITIPNTVASIGIYAFSGCSRLTSVTIGNTVTSIGDGAFMNCTKLVIYCVAGTKPSGWGSSWNNSFCPVIWNCKNNNATNDGYVYEYIDGLRYQLKNHVATVYTQPTTLTGEIVIPSTVAYNKTTYNVTSIGVGAFRGCSGLTNVTIPDSVTSIGGSAFRGCSSLTSVTIPNSVTSIGDYAFENCNRLVINCEAASQPDGWGSSYWNYSSCPVIWNCKNNNTASNGYVYEYIDGLRYQLKDGVATVYQQPTTLTGAVVISSTVTYNETTYNVTSIVSYAFYNCSGLTSVTIPDSVTSIGSYAFRGCSGLTNITFNGTIEQWNAITKGNYWNYNTGAYTIHCTDGDIAKS